LVERFIPGREVAMEGLLVAGELKLLALFDKPDPMDGPFFEETLYITPSRLPDDRQREIFEVAQAAADALGLKEGPVHAEFRINDEGVWPLEMAARTIGGLCSRSLSFEAGMSLEECVLRHALGDLPEDLALKEGASGVMMIPIPRAGTLRAVHGTGGALAVEGVSDLQITIPIGGNVIPLPEGDKYLGFIFAKASAPDLVEQALREAHSLLSFDIS
jgi:biotin carboxylase